MSYLIDGITALTGLRQAVEGKTDFVYEIPEGFTACKYEHGGCPSCLIAVVLHKLGVSVEELALMDAQNKTIYEVTLPEGVALTEEARSILQIAQTIQDNEGTWGDALDHAEDVAKSEGVIV